MSFTRREMALSSIATFALTSARVHATGAPIVAKTSYGRVRGLLVGGDIMSFKGIRYGADTATTRFQPPVPPTPWTGIADATRYGNSAAGSALPPSSLLASFKTDLPESEDCLFLNVWTPGLRDGRRRPVLVWMHGGGFAMGDGSSSGFDGERMARRGDAVIITLNHRLNIFGFLNLSAFGPHFSDSANVGLLDLILALQWVRDNAAAFGGDAKNVTIFGQSGGGAKVSTLLAMDGGKGLFHKAAIQSGAAINAIPNAQSQNLGRAVVSSLGLSSGSVNDILKLSTSDIQTATAKALGGNPMSRLMAFAPTVDGRSLKRDPFAPDAPPQSRNIPILVGSVRTETTNLMGAMDASLFSLTWESLPMRLAKAIPGVDSQQVIDVYKQRWPNLNASDVFFEATTDAGFRRKASLFADRKAAQNSAPAYLYMVDWNSPVEGGKWRSQHAVEVGFVFDTVEKSASMAGVGPEQQRMADIMSTSWLAFAKSGNPDNPLIPHWPAYDPAVQQTMIFAPQPHVENAPRERKLFDTLPLGPF